jgi:hypothetical protein
MDRAGADGDWPQASALIMAAVLAGCWIPCSGGSHLVTGGRQHLGSGFLVLAIVLILVETFVALAA